MNTYSSTCADLAQIFTPHAIHEAWEQVARKKSAPGLDGVTIQDFARHHASELKRLRDDILSLAYHPQPLIAFPKEKENGDYRILTIAGVRDRIAARTAGNWLVQQHDRELLPQSYAFRPRKGALKAVMNTQRHARKSSHVVRVDIDSCFDSINHDVLDQTLESLQESTGLRDLVRTVVTAPLFDGARQTVPTCGIPQGSPLAPILCNLVLHHVDKTLNEQGYGFVRYADDIVIFASDSHQASAALGDVQAALSGIQLSISSNKTRIHSVAEGFVFLGFLFHENGKTPCRDARLRFKKMIAEPKFDDETDSEFAQRRNAIVRGWYNYFHHGEDRTTDEPIDIPAEPGADPAPSKPSQTFDHDVPLVPDRDEINQLLEEGKFSKVITILRRALMADESPLSDADRAAYRTQLALLYDRVGMSGSANRCRGNKHQTREREDLVPGMRNTQTWLDTFGHGRGIARQFVDSVGRCGYRPSAKVLSAKHLHDHWRGRHTIAVDVYAADDTVRFALLDLDVTRAALDNMEAAELEAKRRELLQFALKLQELCNNLGIRSVIEDSGYKGYHLWFFLRRPASASLAHRFLRLLADRAGRPPEFCHAECFPNSRQKPTDGLACRIKAPLGLHRLSGRWSTFIAPDGEVCDTVAALALPGQVCTDAKSLRAALDRWNTTPSNRPKSGINDPHCSSNDEVLHRKCAVLAELARKAKTDKRLNHYERIVLRGILTPLGGEGKDEMHNILRNCTNYNPHTTDKMMSNDHLARPMSCHRIQEILCDMCQGLTCNCRFKARAGSVPSPLRHLRSAQAPSTSANIPKPKKTIARKNKAASTTKAPKDPPASKDIDTLHKYRNLRKKLIKLQKKLKNIEGKDLGLGCLVDSGTDTEIHKWNLEI